MQIQMMKSVLSTALLVSFILLLGRLSGFFRETIMAASFGPTAVADMAVVILTLPDFMLGLLLAGGFNAALIPALMQAEGAARLALLRRVALLIFALFAVLAAGLAIWPGAALSWLTPSQDLARAGDGITAFRLSLLGLPLVALVGVAGAYLNVKGSFAMPNISVLLFNLIIIAYLLLVYSSTSIGLLGFAVAVVLACGLRLLLHIALMPETLTAPPRAEAGAQVPLIPRKLWLGFLVGTLGYSLMVGAPVLFRSLHASEGAGQLALFNFAQKLFELPSAILIAPIVTILLPKLSGLAGPSDQAEFEESLSFGLLGGFALGAVAAALGAVFMGYFAQIVYLYGAMSVAQVQQISQMAVIFLFSLPMLAIAQIAFAALNAKGLPLHGLAWAALALGLSFVGYLGLRAMALPQGLMPAALGYGLFHAVLALGMAGDALRLGPQRGHMLRHCLISAARSAAAIAPFAILTQTLLTDLTRWQGIALAVPALALQLWAQKPYILPLARLRLHKG